MIKVKYDMYGRPTYDIINELCSKYMAPKSTEVIPHIPPIKNVIFNNPATIVFWADNTKTVVKCENEEFDPEKGLAMAISKKALGNQGNYFNEFKKWTEKYYEKYVPMTASEIIDIIKKNMDKLNFGFEEKADET